MDEEAMKDILRRLLDSGEYMRHPIQWAMLKVLIGIHCELKAIREATENEAVEDADPEPFQTLNGPVETMVTKSGALFVKPLLDQGKE